MSRFMKTSAPAIALFALALTGCSNTTSRMRGIEESGFLSDYSQLQKGESGQAQLVYVNPNADFGKYKRILMAPVEVYALPGSPLDKLAFPGTQGPEKVKAMADYLDAAIRAQLAEDYEFVTEPGPDVMRLRAAITEAKGSKPLLNTVSAVVPQMAAVSTLKKVATGTHTAVAKTRGEMEILDSVTGERLVAGVDARAGRKWTLRLDKLSPYAQVRDALDHWAVRIKERLAEARAAGAAGAN